MYCAHSVFGFISVTAMTSLIMCYQYIASYFPVVNEASKINLVLGVTWVWAKTGLLLTKIFERGFKMVLQMPDSWLSIPADYTKKIKTLKGDIVHVYAAASERGMITNKLKLFLQFYWESLDGDIPFFDFAKFSKLLNCSMLYCCYILIEANGTTQITPNEFIEKANKFLITCTTVGDKNTYVKTDVAGNKSNLMFRSVNFEPTTVEPDVAQYNYGDLFD